jgi:hypothetical protein
MRALSLVLDVGRVTPQRIRSFSQALTADVSAESLSTASSRIHLVELEWDMQTGNFIAASLDLVTAATTPVPGQLQCLSALVASGSRCLQVILHFTSSPPTLLRAFVLNAPSVR